LNMEGCLVNLVFCWVISIDRARASERARERESERARERESERARERERELLFRVGLVEDGEAW